MAGLMLIVDVNSGWVDANSGWADANSGWVDANSGWDDANSEKRSLVGDTNASDFSPLCIFKCFKPIY